MCNGQTLFSPVSRVETSKYNNNTVQYVKNSCEIRFLNIEIIFRNIFYLGK